MIAFHSFLFSHHLWILLNLVFGPVVPSLVFGPLSPGVQFHIVYVNELGVIPPVIFRLLHINNVERPEKVKLASVLTRKRIVA